MVIVFEQHLNESAGQSSGDAHNLLMDMKENPEIGVVGVFTLIYVSVKGSSD